MRKLKLLPFFFAFIAVLPLTGGAQSPENFPNQSVKISVGFPPGNTTDAIARILADEVGKSMGRPFVVHNQPGAAGTLAVDGALRAVPDGHTLVMASSGSIAIAPALFNNLPYDVANDFLAISITSKIPLVVVVNPQSDIQSISDLIEFSKSNDVSYGSSGNGTTQHLASEMFKEAAQFESVHIPYKGSGQVLTDLMGGAIQWAVESTASTLGLIKSGKLRPLAVTTLDRIETLPDVPALAELGFNGFEATAWTMLGSPKNTPMEIIRELSSEVAKAASLPEVQARYRQLGVVPPFSSSPEEAQQYIRSETEKWASVVKLSGASVD